MYCKTRPPLSLGLELWLVFSSLSSLERDIQYLSAVGANNHRQFVLFLLNLVIGIITFIYLTYQCKYLFNLGARFTLNLFPRFFHHPGASGFAHLSSPRSYVSCSRYKIQHFPCHYNFVGCHSAYLDDHSSWCAILAGVSPNDISRSQ